MLEALADPMLPALTCAPPAGPGNRVSAWEGQRVVWRFSEGSTESAAAERRAQQLVALSFFLLAAYIVVQTLGTLAGDSHPEVSWPGIALAAFTAVTCPCWR